jgi:phage virion morphogenesis protein
MADNSIIKVTPANLEAIKKIINERAARGENMQRISGILGSGIERNFAAEGRPKWQDLAPSTKRARARKGKWPGEILRVTGQLATSIQEFFTATSAGAGTNKIYAAIQNFGGDITQYARSQKNYFHANEKTGEIGNRFVKKHKSNFSQWATIGTHTITIPGREFAKITPQEEWEINQAALAFFTGG